MVNPGYEMGRMAAERLLRAIDSTQPLPPERILLPYALKERESVRDLR
jgi:DNA-binding LacI/PurR family transcriptional regulator